jgi:hypothetical protein
MRIKGHSGDLGVNGRIILKYILNMYFNTSLDSVYYTVPDSCEMNNEHLVSLNAEKFLDKLKDC